MLSVSPWAALGDVSGHDSHPTLRKSPLSRDGTGAVSSRAVTQTTDRGFDTQFMAELLLLGDPGLKKCILKKSQAAFCDADTCSCLAAHIWLGCTF